MLMKPIPRHWLNYNNSAARKWNPSMPAPAAPDSVGRQSGSTALKHFYVAVSNTDVKLVTSSATLPCQRIPATRADICHAPQATLIDLLIALRASGPFAMAVICRSPTPPPLTPTPPADSHRVPIFPGAARPTACMLAQHAGCVGHSRQRASGCRQHIRHLPGAHRCPVVMIGMLSREDWASSRHNAFAAA